MIIGAHGVIDLRSPMPAGEVDDCVATMDRCGVDRVLSQVHTGWPVTLERCVAANRAMARAARAAPERIVAVASSIRRPGRRRSTTTGSASRGTASPGRSSG